MKRPAESTPIALIIVNDRQKSTLIKKALKNFFSLFETEQSFGAVDWLKHFQASVIILDEAALTKTWPLFVQHIRKLPGYADVPILLISNNLKKTFLTQALSYGISDFLLDPLDADEVYQRVFVSMKSIPLSKRVSFLTKKISRSALPKTNVSLPKRFLVTEEVIKRVSQSRAQQSPLSLMLLEIDRFDEITHLHNTFEVQEIIDALTSLVKTHLRKHDFFLPQGNGRFLLIFPQTSQRAAAIIAEMIREEVEIASFPFSIPMTLSMGLIAFDTHPKHNIYDQFEAFLGKVDSALSEAKEKGNTLIKIKKRNS